MTAELEPPWAKFPTYTRYTIGWRMGAGEDWLFTWRDFVARELTSVERRIAYLRRHPPAPRTWRNAIVDLLDVEPEARSSTSARGIGERPSPDSFVADDIAYSTWLARVGAVTAPWTWAGGLSPHDAARYWTRDVGFWARWIEASRRASELTPWLAAQPEPGPEWDPVVAALLGADAPEPDDLLVQLLCALARTGTPPPPWTRPAEPPQREWEINPPLAWSDVWLLWVSDLIDDEPSWRAYLNEHPPAPADWAAALVGELDWAIVAPISDG